MRAQGFRATRFGILIVVASMLAGLLLPAVVQAGDRQFIVMLANSPKQFPDSFGQPPDGLSDPEAVNREYFDKTNPLIGSFAEYWEEISYGDVTISGRTTDWISLPWRVSSPEGNTPGEFYDLNGNDQFAYGTGESFSNETAAAIIDLDGDNPDGSDNGPYFPGAGSLHVGAAGRPVWMPGERWIDVDEDGKWDGLDECNNWMDWDGDYQPDLAGPWIDLNGDGQATNSGGCTCVGDDSCFLADSDNDGNPDCCPDGPGTPGCGLFACPPTTWTNAAGDTITDCNGNLIDDTLDIVAGTSLDQLPYEDRDGACQPSLQGNGIPDECEYGNHTTQCVDSEPTPEDVCAGHPVCENLDPPFTSVARCESADAFAMGGNGDDQLNLVEPFENFLRRWDPCLFDPDVSTPNIETERTHWIKVYDPNSDNVGTPLTCDSPTAAITYGSASYINNNYPGNTAAKTAVFSQTDVRTIYGNHDPLNRLADGACFCADGSECGDVMLPDGSTLEGKYCAAGTHAEYNPPDSWTNRTSDRGPNGTTLYSTKMQAAPGSGGQASFATATPEPGSYGPYANMGEVNWFSQAWTDRYSYDTAHTSPAPLWPQGFDPMGPPVPGGPSQGRPVPNTLLMEPFDEADANGYDPAVHRRFFKANFGGLNGRGVGWIGDDMDSIVFETGNMGQFGFEEAMNHPIMPEEANGVSQPGIFYDGWVEHDDLPSSKYHWAGDERLGEVTCPFTRINLDGDEIFEIYGSDLGTHNPNNPNPGGGGDMLTPAAGPYAVNIHGNFGRDAGNLLAMELLTWRTDGTSASYGFVWETINGTGHPFAGPGPGGDMLPNEDLGFRDYNLDGLLDQGEVRNIGSENYLADSYPGTNDDGVGSVYPWNRMRLVEDCVEILDEVVAFDEYVDPVAQSAVECVGGLLGELIPQQMWTSMPPSLPDIVFPNGVLSGLVLLPPGTDQDYVVAPGFYPIHTQDIDDEEDNWPKNLTHQVNWSIFFHDLVIAEDSTGESAAVHPGGQFQVPTTAHEYGHAWQGWPDLYDYDVFAPPGPVINCPVGRWDIMATGGLVHPTAPLKAAPCTEWIDPVDLTTVITPGVSTVLTLPPAELVRNNSYFYLENYAVNQGQDRVERYYLWSAAGTPPSGPTFDTPGFPGFGVGAYATGGMPGEGMLMMHTDRGADADALPQQQRFGGHFTYSIVQADGLHELEGGINVDPACGDDGDPFPGSTNNTYFDFDTNPASRWYAANSFTGLQITNIVPDGQGAVSLTLNWVPTSIPGLTFIDPPGGSSVTTPSGEKVYQVRVRASDLYGGTRIRFFYTDDETDLTINPDGANYIGAIHKQTTGTNQLSLDWVIDDVPDDRYYVFAELVPGEGADQDENSFTTPRAGRQNAGDGTLVISPTTDVNTNEVVATGLIGVYQYADEFYAIPGGGGFFNFIGAGVQVGDQLVTGPLPGSSQQIMRTITSMSATVLTLSAPVIPLISPPGSGDVTDWIITHSGRTARLETWMVECVDTLGSEWTVYSSLTQPKPADDDPNQDPYPHAFTDAAYTSAGGEVTFTVTSGTTAFSLGDTFAFTTTGLTDVSAGVTVLHGIISEGPVAIVTAEPLAGPAPHVVEFDGRDSFDPNGVGLVYEWDFGDGQSTSGPSFLTHTYHQAGTFTAVLRVTNPQNNLFGEAVVDVVAVNNTPHAVVQADPLSGGKPLLVAFDATQSSDTETPENELTYQWDFGDGETANGAGDPGFQIVDHTYTQASNDPVTYIALLTVTDADGGVDTDTVSILVGNTLPIPSVYHTGLSGSTPLTVKFNASQSYDADGDAMTIVWTWGDGSVSASLPTSTGTDGAGNVSHTFTLPSGETEATYQVTAVITDARGGSATWPGVEVQVAEAQAGASQPQAVFTVAPDPPLLNEVFQVDGHLSYDRPSSDPAATITSYSWDFGDGSPVVTNTSPLATHTYTVAATYTISLTVADNETPPNTHTFAKTVNVLGEGIEPGDEEDNLAPSARMSVSPSTGYAGVTRFTFNGEFSSDADGDALTYRWFFGDGQTSTGVEVTHVFNTPGTYSARLMVSDTKNASAVATQTITVLDVGDNRSPVAFIATGPRSGTAPVSLTFDGSISYDPDGDPLVYNWSFRLNGEVVATASNALVTVRFDEPGTYAVELEVADNRGGSDATEPEIVVIAKRGTLPDDDDDDQVVDPDAGADVPNSADQRSSGSGICGLGMVMSFFGSLLGLAGLAGARRRRLL